MPRADWNVISASLLSVPSKPEQTKIADFLSAIDDKINLVNQQLEKTKEYKKGLLQITEDVYLRLCRHSPNKF